MPGAAGHYSVMVSNSLDAYNTTTKALVAKSAPLLTLSQPASLVVTQSFASWAATAGLTGTNAAANAAPDGDGIVNYVKYALGLSPKTPDAGALPKLTPENGQMVFRFTQPNYVTGTSYRRAILDGPGEPNWTPVTHDHRIGYRDNADAESHAAVRPAGSICPFAHHVAVTFFVTCRRRNLTLSTARASLYTDMPLRFRIDHNRRLVIARGYGVLTHQQIFRYQHEVWSNPDVDGYNELMDFTKVKKIDLPSAEKIQELAELAADMDNPFTPSKFAIIAPGDEAFGLSRMYQTYRSMMAEGTKTVGVFRSHAEAFKFLEIQEDPEEED